MKYLYDFQQLETIRSLGDSIQTGKITTDEAEIIRKYTKFNNKSKPKTKEVRLKNKILQTV